jgi:hypothetical protein
MRARADMFPGNSYSEHSDLFAAITRGLDIIGAAESALFPGRRPAAEIGILYLPTPCQSDEQLTHIFILKRLAFIPRPPPCFPYNSILQQHALTDTQMGLHFRRYPRSSFMWDEWGQNRPTTIEDETNNNMDGRTTEYMAEVHGLFALLSQSYDFPIDFIDEDDAMNATRLSARFRVVFVTEPSLPVESQAALAAFAAGGGTVVLTRGAAMLDR